MGSGFQLKISFHFIYKFVIHVNPTLLHNMHVLINLCNKIRNLPDVSILWVGPLPFWLPALSPGPVQGSWYIINTCQVNRGTIFEGVWWSTQYSLTWDMVNSFRDFPKSGYD